MRANLRDTTLAGARRPLATGTLVALDVAGLDVAVPVAAVTRAGGYLGGAARTLLAELRQPR